jgi:D-3-phosphoglycerate dehydrogenase / 2-oxoglutarate reductase
MNITVLDDWQDTVRTLPAFAKVAGHPVTIWNDHTKDVDVLAKRLADTEALCLIRERTPIRAPLLERLDRLRIISQIGVFPHVDLAACTKRGVIMSSLAGAGGGPSYATAELTWGMIIAAFRHIHEEAVALKAGKWQAYPIGVGLRGKTLGIWGYGKIGAVVAGYGRAFGMKVLAFGREASVAAARAAGDTVATREQMLEQSDVVSIHLRLIDATRGIVTATDLGRMKPSALFVNTSRAGLVAPGALEAALRAGRPGLAAVDVFEEEPIPAGGHPLLKMDNVLALPHLGYVERDGLEHQFSTIFDQILAYAAGAPINVHNPEALKG